MDKVSIIIPCYNIAPYIGLAIESILSQTYTNYEVILVDDGSTDETFEVCKQYTLKDNRFKVFYKENGGVSSARNVGLDLCTGDWVFFMDGDDILYPHALSTLMDAVQRNKCEIAEANFERIKNGVRIYSPLISRTNYVEDSACTIKNTLVYNRCMIIPRLFKHSIIGRLRFEPAIKVGEDALFVVDLLLRNNVRIAHSESVVYQYMQCDGSAMHNATTCEGYDVLSEAMSGRLADFKEYKDYLQLFCCLNLYFEVLRGRKGVSQDIYNKYMGNLCSLVFRVPTLAYKFKLILVCYGISRRLGNLMMKIRKYVFPVN